LQRASIASCAKGWLYRNQVFLRVIEVDEEKWVGKVVKGGIAVTEIDDMQRNILSILRRVAPNTRIPPSQLKIFVLQGATAAALRDPNQIIDDDEGEEEAAAPAGSTDDGGAFITY
jgi:hypothetical protein